MLRFLKSFLRGRRNYYYDKDGFKVKDERTGHILDVKLKSNMFSGRVIIPEKGLELPLSPWPKSVNLFQDDFCFKGNGSTPSGEWSFHIEPTDPFSEIMENVISLSDMKNKEKGNYKKEKGEDWMEVLFDWADKLGLEELRWEPQPRNRDGGFWVGFPRSRKKLIKLQGLNINGVGATEVPKEVGNLKGLKKIWCCDNRISELPKELFFIAGLEEIRASGNNIKKLPDEVGLLQNLIILDLEKNNLQYVSENISKLRRLERLDVRDQPHPLGYVGTPLSDSQVSALAGMGDVVRW
ncbi:leucine-rich repeat domain-containing protein [Halomonas cupida]|uniref:leucine-rich repeat domain-containing protein n=1 Tax=Halomonas cupida TaxID=44933 RepID=UPI003EF7A46F